MHVLSSYLEKQDFYCPHINEKVPKYLGLIVVIPCFDEDRLFDTLNSILNCNKPDSSVEVIVVINFPENAKDEVKQKHKELFAECSNWTKEHASSQISFHFLYAANLRKKYAGAGWARKIGMDEAIYRFFQIDNPNGIICSLDADVKLEENYFIEVEKLFKKNNEAEACSIYFEHDIQGDEFDLAVYESIEYYELYLRYYLEGLRISGYPYAYHTIGSCFAVKAITYAKQGGMSKRQGGEDFYFLHKIIPQGCFYELNSTCVYPSPRPSHRVPFGTGPTISKYINIEDKAINIKTVRLRGFQDLNKFFSSIDQLFKKPTSDYLNIISELPETLVSFLSEIEFEKTLAEINSNAATLKNFRNRFYRNFNALMILRFLNHAHKGFYKQGPLLEEVRLLLTTYYNVKPDRGADGLLGCLRQVQREGGSFNLLQR